MNALAYHVPVPAENLKVTVEHQEHSRRACEDDGSPRDKREKPLSRPFFHIVILELHKRLSHDQTFACTLRRLEYESGWYLRRRTFERAVVVQFRCFRLRQAVAVETCLPSPRTAPIILSSENHLA